MQNNLKSIDDMRNDEGLAKQVHKSLEEIVKNIERGESPVMTLAQSNIDVE